MVRLTLRGLAAAKLRFALTGLAVVLGTAFVAGALVFGDTLEQRFEALFAEVAGPADVQVHPDEAVDDPGGDPRQDGEAAAEPATVPAGLLEEVRALDETAVADGEIQGPGVLIDEAGEPVGEVGPPTLAVSRFEEPELRSAELREGRWPREAGELAVDAGTADAQGWSAGDAVRVALDGPAEPAEIVGVFGVGEFDNLGGATIVLLDRAVAADELGTGGDFTALHATAADGVGDEELADAVAAAVGDGYTVRTADEVASDEQQAIAEVIDVFSSGMLVFAGVSLLVAAFLIVNTFTVVLAQRVRELALLRVVGASRGQLFGSVVGEAAVVGLVGGLLGAGAGLGVAVLLRRLMGAVGVGWPGEGLVVQPRTVVVAVALGVVVTVVAALAPARRAVRTPPVAALGHGSAGAVAGRRWPRLALSGLLLAGGAAALAVGLVGEGGAVAVGAGAAGVLLGVAGLSPLAAGPAAAAIGWPTARLRGVRGQLARLNAARHPRRTAATASALMIGLALVGFVAVFAESLRASTTAAVEEMFAADVVLTAATGGDLPEPALEAAEAADEVAVVAERGDAELDIAGEPRRAAIMDAGELLAAFDFAVTDGEPDAIRDGGVIASESAADEAGLAAGDTVAVETADGVARLPVAAVVDGAGLRPGWFVARDAYDAAPPGPTPIAYVALAGGAAGGDGDAAVADALADYPQVEVLDRAGVADRIGGDIDRLLAVFAALLALSVLIALLGVVNTLALSVVERVREIGLLRAVGMTRAQVRAMVRSEAGIVALLGAALGLVLGLAFGAAVVAATDDIGLAHLTIPWARLGAGVAALALAGLAAGVLPARRAARVDVLSALATE